MEPEWPVDLSHDSEGNTFDETSAFWKLFCKDLPCTAWMGWPNYYTAVLPVRIGKQKYMIQVWKGHCERVPDAVGDAITSDGIHFPGGVGAEVGIYLRDENRPKFTLWELRVPLWAWLRNIFDSSRREESITGESLEAPRRAASELGEHPEVPAEWSPEMKAAAAEWGKERFLPSRPAAGPLLSGEHALMASRDVFPSSWAPGYSMLDQWFPALDLAATADFEVEFTLSTPTHTKELISRYRTNTYWTCKWMHTDDYHKWYSAWQKANQAGPSDPLPEFHAHELHLDFWVNGVHYRWYEGSKIVRVRRPLAQALREGARSLFRRTTS
jgi:hypothetical protein